MRKLVSFAIVCVGMFGALNVYADNLVPFFSHGPSIQAFRIGREKSSVGLQDWNAKVLTAGAGYSFNFNVLCKSGCQTAWLTVGIPLYLSYVTSKEQNTFSFSPALSIGTFNNLVSLAIGYSAFDFASDRESLGWMIGRTDRALMFYTLNFGFNLGSGQKATTQLAPGTPEKPPTNFMAL